jgi:hypothetical protein
VIAIAVDCVERSGAAWTCHVTLTDGAGVVSSHEVAVARADLDMLDPGAPDPTDLVKRSFAFLLEREPPGSILRSFDLPVIGRYFPEYASRVGRSARAG